MNLRDYDICACQNRLTSNWNTEYFINSVTVTARNFFLVAFLPGMNFADAATIMKHEYDSDSRHLQVQSSLEWIHLEIFMEARSITMESEGLNKIVEQIERLHLSAFQVFALTRIRAVILVAQL